MPEIWTPAREAMLREYYGTRPAAKVAHLIMTLLPGALLSPSAVTGKANRLGLNSPNGARRSPVRHAKPEPQPAAEPKPQPTVIVVEEAAPIAPEAFDAVTSPADPVEAAPEPEHLDPAGLSDTTQAVIAVTGCRWPHGEPGRTGFRFCNAPRARDHRSYCAEHAAAAVGRQAA